MSYFLTALLKRATEQAQEHSPYGYVPTRWITILFLVLFTISTSESTPARPGVHRANNYVLQSFILAKLFGFECGGYCGRLSYVVF